jgi:hypothetical protein
VASGNCLAVYVDNDNPGACPTSQASAALDKSGLVWGPANSSMTVTNLYAYSPTTFSLGQAVTITVLVNGAPSAVSCTVTGPGTGTTMACSSTASVSLSPGDFLAVQVGNPAIGTFVAAVWRVSLSLQ